MPHTTAVLLCFFVAFLVAYLIGYFDLSDSDALSQWGKGMTKWVIHFLFLAAAVVWLSRRGQRYFWKTLVWFTAGFVVNALYGVLQLLDARRGGNLDSVVLSPITGGASQINVYGAINGANVYRPNALTGDPNHLGIMLIVPLLVLTPLYLRLEKGHPARRWLMVVIGFLLVVEATTLSRSGLLGLGVGALVLLLPYRRYLRSAQLLVPIGAALALLLAIVLSRRSFFTTVLKSRVADGRQLGERALPGVLVHPTGVAHRPAVRTWVEHLLGLLRVRHRQDELGAALVLRRSDRRDGPRRDGAVRGLRGTGCSGG